jgi:Ca-activated chloride channel family protein
MQLFRFANPEFLYLLLLLPVMIMLFIISVYRRRRTIRKIGDQKLVHDLLPELSAIRPAVKFQVSLYLPGHSLVLKLKISKSRELK